MRLRSIGETDDNNVTPSKLTTNSSVEENTNAELGSQLFSFKEYHTGVITTLKKLKDEIGDDISESDSDFDSCSTHDDDDNYSAGGSKNSPIKYFTMMMHKWMRTAMVIVLPPNSCQT